LKAEDSLVDHMKITKYNLDGLLGKTCQDYLTTMDDNFYVSELKFSFVIEDKSINSNQIISDINTKLLDAVSKEMLSCDAKSDGVFIVHYPEMVALSLNPVAILHFMKTTYAQYFKETWY
jgi:hypothetical protein